MTRDRAPTVATPLQGGMLGGATESSSGRNGMSRIAYVNGRYLPQRDASVNIEDRGYQFADGIYEVVHLYDGRFIDEDLHLDRLARSLRAISLPKPMSRAALRHVLYEVARRNRVREGLLYMQVTRGVARRDHPFPSKPVPPSVVVTIRRIPPYPTDVGTWTASAINAGRAATSRPSLYSRMCWRARLRRRRERSRRS
jgi:branched-subunit amino acid aminotransferase/4-amino-4-deoxychorismate lyase